jgi:hypothetical protein
MDTTAYTNVAFGLLQRNARSPYHFGGTGLNDPSLASAIAPSARGIPSSTGSLGIVLQHLAVSITAGNAVGALIVLRALCVVAAILVARFAADLAANPGADGVQQRRAVAVALTAANPLLLLYVVSAGHLDGLMLALVLAALAAATQRRWFAALLLAVAAGSIDGQGFVAVPVVLLAHWSSNRAKPLRGVVVRDLFTVTAVTALAGLAAGRDGFGWISEVHRQFSVRTPFSVPYVTARILSPIVRGASYDDLMTGAQIAAITAMVCALGYLLITFAHRTPVLTVGYALMVIALLAPVLNPWYLLWGALCLAADASGRHVGWVLALSGVGCVLAPQGFSNAIAEAITGTALALAFAVWAGALAARNLANGGPHVRQVHSARDS